MVVQMNALMVWAGIGLVGFGVGALMVALQARPKRETTEHARNARSGGAPRVGSQPRGREMTAH